MDNVFQVAIQTLNKAGKLGDINPRVLDILQEPKRIQQFRIPLKLEDGSFQVFQAYRVHYCDALGPFRNGTRIRPDLSLDEIKALEAEKEKVSLLREAEEMAAKGDKSAEERLKIADEVDALMESRFGKGDDKQ